uniref:Cl40696_1 n=1 Tax=Arundo donax TaxID=35708 RepID=A0A0A9CFW2_ARUDO
MPQGNLLSSWMQTYLIIQSTCQVSLGSKRKPALMLLLAHVMSKTVVSMVGISCAS